MLSVAITKLCFFFGDLFDKKMAQKASLRLLVLFLAFTYIVSCAAVPTTRSFMSNREGATVQDLLSQDIMDSGDGKDLYDLGERFVEGRMDFETVDYKAPGRNTGHEPKTPARA